MRSKLVTKITHLVVIVLLVSCQSEQKQILKECTEYSNCRVSDGLIHNDTSPFNIVKSVGLNDCNWTSGFWADRFKLCHEVMVPNIWNLVSDPDLSHIYENFLVAAGEKEGVFRGFLFGDGDFLKVVEAMCHVYAVTGDSAIDKQLDQIIEVIAKGQRADGYITTGKVIGRGTKMNFNHTQGGSISKEKTFISDRQHELYNYGHLFTAACIHYRITGKTNFLEVAIKAADHLYDHFHIPSPELAAIHWNAPHFMGLVELYRTTGDKKYLELTNTFINMLGTTNKGVSGRALEHSQKKTKFREETKAVGHAVHANYLYCGIADAVAETGDEELLKSLNSIWDNVVYDKMYVTGATGAHDRHAIGEKVVGEAYGKEYDLPNERAYAETCANIGNAMWNWRMFLMEGDAKYMDVAELALYNSALASISLDGKHFFYHNPLSNHCNHPEHANKKNERKAYLKCFCCPPNIVRTIAKVHNYAYSTSEKGIWVNLYGGNSLVTKLNDGTEVKLSQVTEYPWDGAISIGVDIEEKKNFSMMLRIPEWAEGAEIKVNGKRTKEAISAGSYFELKRYWDNGDVIELDLPMEAKLMQGNPFVENVSNQVAIQRGPIVYCLESIDLPEDASISDVVIPQDINLKPEYIKDELLGATVLKGTALLKPKQDWNKRLYTAINSQKLSEVDIQLIPYYAWNNRGESDMTVWMPVKY